ncbi:VanZ like family protein [Maioricimonas rarisocia]|uniref:VanZ like family protein n=1 Tax=Maioricimonas rarisocia TaxID=2528026 RepID=A0A517Z0R2_9PLAN|nr:VanZ family protein [Maioricimonas rarisocia]QDU36067.1 VanZ like family protein [Maioricimonas rarisocia]
MSVRTNLPHLHLLLAQAGGLMILAVIGLSLIQLVLSRLHRSAGPDSLREQSSEARVKELATWIVGATAVFALYGSLLPFNFQQLPAEVVRTALDRFLRSLNHLPSKRDFLLNVTLFLPFGYGMFAWLEPRPGWDLRQVRSLIVLPAACLLVSLPAELGQIWLQGRVCSAWDVAAHLAGSLLGAAGWLLTSRAVIRHIPADDEEPAARPARLVLYAYIAIVLLASLFPFDLVPNLSSIADAYRRGRIQLQFTLPDTPDELKELIFHAFFCIPLGVLAASLFVREGRVRYAPALLVAACLAAGVEFLQLWIRSRFSQVNHAFVGTLGAWFGVITSDLMFRLRRNCEDDTRHPFAHPATWLNLAILYSLFPLFFFSWPADLTGLLESPQLQSLQSLPFQRLHQASPLNASTLILQKVLLYIPTGYLCATAILCARDRFSMRLTGIVATVVIFAVPIAVEWLQLYLPDRTADVTDVLLGTFGGLIGVLTVQATRQGVVAPVGVCMKSGLLEFFIPSSEAKFGHFMRDGASIRKRELTQSFHGYEPVDHGRQISAGSADDVTRAGANNRGGRSRFSKHAVARPESRGYPVSMSHSEYASACGMTGPLRLLVEDQHGNGTSHTFTRPTVLVGRMEGCDLQLEFPEVARRHLLFQLIDGRWAWFDLTGLSPRESGWLNSGNRLQCGPFAIRLHDDADKPAPSARHQGAVRNDRGSKFQLSFHNALQAQSGPKYRRLRDLVTLVGRVPPAHIRLAHPTVSRIHCLIVNTHRGLWLTDLASTSGTFVNERLVDVARLNLGDEIHIGDYDVTLSTQNTPLTASEQSDEKSAASSSELELPAIDAATSWPAIMPQPSDGDISTSRSSVEITGSSNGMLGTLLEHFSAMQREMMQQSQQQMMMMMQMFGQLQKSQLEAIREDLQRVQEITRELCEAQAQFAAQEATRQAASQQEHHQLPPPPATFMNGAPSSAGQLPWLPGLSPPVPPEADEAEEEDSRPRASHKDVTTHAQLSERIRVLERERNSRWQKIVSFLSTGS